jgi:hypothetical protein
VGEKKQKLKRQQRLLTENPLCCFCGGLTPSSTVDHVPPQACFQAGFFPEGFEFPACKSCNSSSRKDDQIFAYHIQLADPNWANKDVKTLLRIQNGVRNNFPGALPNTSLTNDQKRKALAEMGIEPPADDILTNLPLAGISKEFRDSAQTIGRKLGCALYFKETGKPLTKEHFIWTATFHMPGPNAQILTDYLANLLPDERKGGRKNVKNYGNRFGYKSGYKPDEDFFVASCQFGDGMAVLTITGRRDKNYKSLPSGEMLSVFDPPGQPSAAPLVAREC